MSAKRWILQYYLYGLWRSTIFLDQKPLDCHNNARFNRFAGGFEQGPNVRTWPTSSENWHVDFPTTNEKRIFRHTHAHVRTHKHVHARVNVLYAHTDTRASTRLQRTTVDVNLVKKSDESLLRKLRKIRFGYLFTTIQ